MKNVFLTHRWDLGIGHVTYWVGNCFCFVFPGMFHIILAITYTFMRCIYFVLQAWPYEIRAWLKKTGLVALVSQRSLRLEACVMLFRFYWATLFSY